MDLKSPCHVGMFIPLSCFFSASRVELKVGTLLCVDQSPVPRMVPGTQLLLSSGTE